MKIVTSGSDYTDIDAYGCIIAYAELLNLLGEDAVAKASKTLSSSITQTIRSWPAKVKLGISANSGDSFVLVDVSDPNYVKEFTDPAKVVEVIDHHAGSEDFWKQRLGDKAQIELIGAACTLIYEKWQQNGKLDQLSEISARLLACGILDNTLNFQAKVTSERDKHAYRDLASRGNLPDDWPEKYFEECQASIESQLEEALYSDFKQFSIPALPPAISQITVWDARGLLQKKSDDLNSIMRKLPNGTCVNMISIQEGHNFLFTINDESKLKLSKLLKVTFEDNVAQTDRLWLRKEILKEALNAD